MNPLVLVPFLVFPGRITEGDCQTFLFTENQQNHGTAKDVDPAIGESPNPAISHALCIAPSPHAAKPRAARRFPAASRSRKPRRAPATCIGAVSEPAPLFGGAESSRCGRIHAVPSRQPGGAPLAELRLGAAGGALEFMAFQGRATSALSRGFPRTAADAGTMLDGVVLCIGLAHEARSQHGASRQHTKYSQYVAALAPCLP